ncbi:arginase family protein [Carboxylicivirga sediminis]|uniref:Arginase family protein n=1 Tax=Carboxylicivirga sediminis TaxID=2006564 RepID=A0A941F1D5_9BACT|nr:arginase family protein [Carboxylicivirga sediminis]MBR8534986.1 arginase family protein [Carboxylicivirga sediminis]
MTEDWIHYFNQPNYKVINAFEGLDEDRLKNGIDSFHQLKTVDWDAVDIALIGVNDARNSVHKGSAEAPDLVRSYLAGLRSLSKPLTIVDLGNIRGNTIDDRYKALEDILLHLQTLKVITIVLGGSQDYTLPMAKAVRQYQAKYNLAILDSRIDWLLHAQDYSANNYLGKICEQEGVAPKDVSFVGVQKYLYSPKQEAELHKHSYEILRLGQIRQLGHRLAEPVLRDADLLSVDMTVVRQCDQPAHITPMPNGLSGEELCQLMWYAGQSDRLNVIGVFEQDVHDDKGHQGIVLTAQAIWHILEGIALRYNDYPAKDLDLYRQFIVYLDDYELEIKFYNNPDNDRWWVEIPGEGGGVDVIACGRTDFETASANEIPEKWFRYIQKKSL